MLSKLLPIFDYMSFENVDIQKLFSNFLYLHIQLAHLY
jgi:hypothetical protein